jgi:hypothetical protein
VFCTETVVVSVSFSRVCIDDTTLTRPSHATRLRLKISRFGGNKMENINSDILQAVFSNCTYLQAILVGFNDTIDREETGKKIDKDGHYPSWRLGHVYKNVNIKFQ